MGLYYLKSKYYDSQIGRFINADGIEYLGANGDICAYNLFAYCSDNPVIRVDPSGLQSKEIADMIIISNTKTILIAAKYFDIDPVALGSIIYAEQVLNVGWTDDFLDGIAGFYGIADTSIGIAQVKISTAKLMEDVGLMPKVSASDAGWNLPIIGWVNGTEQMAREKRLENPVHNIMYAAAYLKYF